MKTSLSTLQDLIDSIIGVQSLIMSLGDRLGDDAFDALVARLVERRVKGEKLWEFFRDVAGRDQDAFVRLVNADDPRLRSYATA